MFRLELVFLDLGLGEVAAYNENIFSIKLNLNTLSFEDWARDPLLT